MEEFSRRQVGEQLARLWALPVSSTTSTFIRRGISPASIGAAAAALDDIGGGVMSAEEAVASSFRSRSVLSPFRTGRFSDGSYPVFYAAQDQMTCIEEVRSGLERKGANDPNPRHYKILIANYSGMTLDLLGYEGLHPELVSPTEVGYTFCQALAAQARTAGIDALHTRSARREHGVCVPVFTEQSLSDPTMDKATVTFAGDGNGKVTITVSQ